MSPLELGGFVGGHYQVVARLGAGGMGEVYRAHDSRLERFVALKVLPDSVSRDADRLTRFVREAKILASLNHPNIASIHGIEDISPTTKCLVLELISGVSLRDRLCEGALPLPDALRVCSQIGAALRAAHEGGVIHRDLKPENVMLANGGLVKVLDFGLARRVSSGAFRVTETIDRISGDRGRVVVRPSEPVRSAETGVHAAGRISVEGTPGYMSPEQILGHDQDQRTDIFSLGCVLYECLTGSCAFPGDTLWKRLGSTLHDQPDWSSLPGGTPRSVRTLLINCLEKDLDGRAPHIGHVLSALDDALGHAAARGSSTPNNLPEEVSSFVGREQLLKEYRAILSKTRLFSLVGIGGSGKTRLAIRLARELLDDYPDGVWFFDLVAISDAERLPHMIMGPLGSDEPGGGRVEDALVGVLRGRKTLLVLDNCEHLLAGCSRLVASLLESCPRLQVILTSRRQTYLPGEHVATVPPLGITGRRDAGSVAASEAGRLFLDRASAQAIRFRIDSSNADDVAEICVRLDGLPLAIELAARRIRTIGIRQIREMLRDRFQLLSGPDGVSSDRHATMSAIIDWSYGNLTADEQRLFRRFSVLCGGWTLADAAGLTGMDEFAALDGLSRLVDVGLVLVDRVHGGAARYRMLESVREFARRMVRESGEEEEVRHAHFEYFLSWIRRIDRERLAGSDWRAAIDANLENLLAAHAWCDEDEERAERGLHLVFALRNYWLPRGLVDLGLRVSSEALSRGGTPEHSLTRGKILLTAGILAYFGGRYDDAGRFLDESVAIMREHSDVATLSTTFTGLALVAMSRDERGAARRYLEDAIGLSREADDRASLASALNTLGDLNRSEGAYHASIAAYLEAKEIDEQIDNLEDAAVAHCNLGRAWLSSGDVGRAREALVQLIGTAGTLDSMHLYTGVLDVAVGLAVTDGAWVLAARLVGSCDAHLEHTHTRRDVADEEFLAPFVTLARSRLGGSAYEAAYAAGRSIAPGASLEAFGTWLRAGRGSGDPSTTESTRSPNPRER